MVSSQVNLKEHLRQAMLDSTKLILLEQQINTAVSQNANYTIFNDLAQSLVSNAPED